MVTIEKTHPAEKIEDLLPIASAATFPESGPKKAGGSKTIRVGYLARVEGEGGLYIKIKNGSLAGVRLDIFEPPRLFEGVLVGRDYHEVPDITARICGICPVAHQTTSAQAIESAFGSNLEGQRRDLRRLIYLGEWIESHVLHVHMLHSPDFLGMTDAIAMAGLFPEIVQRGLRLKKTGNRIMQVIGGREIHPVNLKVGGFYKLPSGAAMGELLEDLEWALEASVQTAQWVAGFDYPDFERDYEFVSLRHPTEYPVLGDRIVSNKGLDIPVEDYEHYFSEIQVPHSNALHSVLRFREDLPGGGSYFVGPMARYNLNSGKLSPLAKKTASEIGLGPTVSNPFKGIMVRAVETVYAFEEALRIVRAYRQPGQPAVQIEGKPEPAGCACTEAPRGLLFHRYNLAEDGTITGARIIPPTSQNLRTVEGDLAEFVRRNLHLADKELTHRCEQAIRNYDPCISCSAHFLRLQMDRE